MNPKNLKDKALKIVKFILLFPIGGIIGLFIGLVTTTFIPQCCTENGCHNCFEFRGRVGYEATGLIGFWIGLVICPFIYLFFIKKNKKTQ